MYTTVELQNIINSELENLSHFRRTPSELYKPIEYALKNGGKRLRPVLSLMGCNLFSDEIDVAVKPSIAFEIFHNFTLLHDDIMDNAPIRRNQPTVHSKWNANVAILSGDAMLVIAYHLLTDVPAGLQKSVLDIFSTTALEVCEGQQYDMNFEKTALTTEEEYLEMIRLKTSVLIAAALKVGALLGGSPDKEAGELYRFGINLGMAFQLQDDLLDTYGTSEFFGKKIGGDILMNKKTFLLVKALQLAGKSDLDNLNKLMHEEKNSEKKISGVIKIYNNLDIAGITGQKISEYFSAANKNMNNINAAPERKKNLIFFTKKLISRQI